MASPTMTIYLDDSEKAFIYDCAKTPGITAS